KPVKPAEPQAAWRGGTVLLVLLVLLVGWDGCPRPRASRDPGPPQPRDGQQGEGHGQEDDQGEDEAHGRPASRPRRSTTTGPPPSRPLTVASSRVRTFLGPSLTLPSGLTGLASSSATGSSRGSTPPAHRPPAACQAPPAPGRRAGAARPAPRAEP